MDADRESKHGSGVFLYLCDKQGVNDAIRASFSQAGVTIEGECPSLSGKPEIDVGRRHYVGTRLIGAYLESLRQH